MLVAFIEGDSRAEFEIRLKEYDNAKDLIERYKKAHKEFAENQCPLYKGEWEGSSFKFCHSAIHPKGYGIDRFCSIENCTWHKKEAHKFEDRRKLSHET